MKFLQVGGVLIYLRVCFNGDFMAFVDRRKLNFGLNMHRARVFFTNVLLRSITDSLKIFNSFLRVRTPHIFLLLMKYLLELTKLL